MAPGRPPAFQFYASDWAHSVSSMTLEERGAYITLLAWSWEHGPVPNELKRLAAILGTHVGHARRVSVEVLKRWELNTQGQWVNPRLERTRAEQEAYSKRQHANGKKGGRPRKPEITTGFPVGSFTGDVAKATLNPNESSPISDLQSPPPSASTEHSQKGVPALDELFEQFWTRYPRHDRRTPAEHAWVMLRPDQALFDRIMAALEWQIPMWKSRHHRFTPLAVTYLQESQWRDDPPADGLDESDEAFNRVMAGRGRLQ